MNNQKLLQNFNEKTNLKLTLIDNYNELKLDAIDTCGINKNCIKSKGLNLIEFDARHNEKFKELYTRWNCN